MLPGVSLIVTIFDISGLDGGMRSTECHFLQRDAMRKRGFCRRPVLSVRLSDRLSRSCIVSRRLKISSNFFLGPVAPSF